MGAIRLFTAAGVAAMFCYAQTDRGIITGSVNDQSGAAVPAAGVVATNVNTNVSTSTLTTSSGDFTIPALPVGAYQLRIEKPGFKAAIRDGLRLTAGNTATVNVTLDVGQVTESVQVAATVEQLQTSSAKVSTAVTNKMVDELPLVVGGAMRGAFDLALITPEVNEPEDKGFNIGGAQGGSYGPTLDGVSILTARFN